MKWILFTVALALGIALANRSTTSPAPPPPAHVETVLRPGMKVVATNASGTVAIAADGGISRAVSGSGWSKVIKPVARRSRWNGSLGIYDPGDSWSPGGRVLFEEGKLFFDSESAALRHLYVGSLRHRAVFTNRGLVVGFEVEPVPGFEPVRSVQLWQIYINGQKPDSLRGANDTAISISGGSTPEAAVPHPAPVGYEILFGKEEYAPEF